MVNRKLLRHQVGNWDLGRTMLQLRSQMAEQATGVPRRAAGLEWRSHTLERKLLWERDKT